MSCRDGPEGRVVFSPHTQRAGAPSNPKTADADLRVGGLQTRVHMSPLPLTAPDQVGAVTARILLTGTQAQEGQVTVWVTQLGRPHPEHGLRATKQFASSHPAGNKNEGPGLSPRRGVLEPQNKASVPDQRGKLAARDQPRDFRNQEISYENPAFLTSPGNSGLTSPHGDDWLGQSSSHSRKTGHGQPVCPSPHHTTRPPSCLCVTSRLWGPYTGDSQNSSITGYGSMSNTRTQKLV